MLRYFQVQLSKILNDLKKITSTAPLRLGTFKKFYLKKYRLTSIVKS